MAKVDVKCQFCRQISPVKNMDWQVLDINVIVVKYVEEAFNLRISTVPANRI